MNKHDLVVFSPKGPKAELSLNKQKSPKEQCDKKHLFCENTKVSGRRTEKVNQIYKHISSKHLEVMACDKDHSFYY